MDPSPVRKRTLEPGSCLLGSLEAKGENDHDLAWDKFTNSLPGRAMIVFISDFLEAEDSLSERLLFPLFSLRIPLLASTRSG